MTWFRVATCGDTEQLTSISLFLTVCLYNVLCRVQISVTLDHVLKNSPIDQSKLSKDGNVLIEDFQGQYRDSLSLSFDRMCNRLNQKPSSSTDIIKTAKAMVEQKNKDELFQNFLYHTRQVDYVR